VGCLVVINEHSLKWCLQGDSTVHAFEVSTDALQLSALSDFKADCVHQALSFLPKSSVNVRHVELARAMRLTSNSIEPVIFRVPRLKVCDYYLSVCQFAVKRHGRMLVWHILSSPDTHMGQNVGLCDRHKFTNYTVSSFILIQLQPWWCLSVIDSLRL